MSLSSTTPQWDDNRTSFNSAESLRALIAAVSQDDIQGQAVLAAEALGSGIIIFPKRADEAVIALHGNESTRIESIKVVIGLGSEGLIHEIRRSMGFIQFFLLITSSKACYTNVELGLLMSNMIQMSGVSSKYPCSTAQLLRLIDSLSGHAEKIVPVDLMHEVAVAIDGGNYPRIYQRLDIKDAATLLFRVFDNLHNKDITNITVTGQVGGAWLATVFLWLIPEETELFMDDQLVKGAAQARLTLRLKHEPDFESEFFQNEWEIRIWRMGEDPTTFVTEKEGSTREVGCSFLPLKLTRSYINQHFLSDIGNTRAKAKALHLIGALANAIVCAAVENGKVCYREVSTPFLKLVRQKWLSAYKTISMNYGWNDSITEHSQIMVLSLQAYIKDDSNWIRTRFSTLAAFSVLNSWCVAYFAEQPDGDLHFESSSFVTFNIFQPALYVAADAIATATCDVLPNDRRLSTLGSKELIFIEAFFNKLFGHMAPGIVGLPHNRVQQKENGIEVHEYLRYAVGQLLPEVDDFSERDLAVTSNGYVVGHALLWNIDTQQDSALSLKLYKGLLRRNGFKYNRITEAIFYHSGTLDSTEEVELFTQGEFRGLSPRRPKEIYTLETDVSAGIKMLEIKQYITTLSSNGNHIRCRVSWTKSIACLATAIHLGRGHEMTSKVKHELAQRLRDANFSARWASCLIADPWNYRELNLIFMTLGNEELRFFTAGNIIGKNKIVSGLCVVSHSAPLLACIAIAQLEVQKLGGRSWRVIC